MTFEPFKVDTLENLARQAGIDWKNFEKTINNS